MQILVVITCFLKPTHQGWPCEMGYNMLDLQLVCVMVALCVSFVSRVYSWTWYLV